LSFIEVKLTIFNSDKYSLQHICIIPEEVDGNSVRLKTIKSKNSESGEELFELVKKSHHVITCSSCGKEGHNKRSKLCLKKISNDMSIEINFFK